MLQGLYSEGANCGRWVKITLGQNCVGGSNSQRAVCTGGSALSCALPPCNVSISHFLEHMTALFRRMTSALPMCAAPIAARISWRGCLHNVISFASMTVHVFADSCTWRLCLHNFYCKCTMCAAYQTDQHTGKIIYSYVVDSCANDNYWCREDLNHVDLSKNYLTGQGLLSPAWNGRKITWSFVTTPPSGRAPADADIVYERRACKCCKCACVR